MNNRLHGMIGLAEKAGKIASGSVRAEAAVRGGKACLVLVFSAASENTRERLKKLCHGYGVRALECADEAVFGRAIGKEERVVLAVTDRGFAESIEKLLNNQ